MAKRKSASKGYQSKGRVMITVPNPDKNNTKERFVRIPMSFGASKNA